MSYAAYRQDRAYHETVLQNEVALASSRLQDRLNVADAVGHLLADFLQDTDALHDPLTDLPTPPGVLSWSFLPFIADGELEEHEAQMARVVPGYRVFAFEEGARVPPPPMAQHLPAAAVHSFDDEIGVALGWDAMSQPEVREALATPAPDGGEHDFGATAPFELSSFPGRRLGMILEGVTDPEGSLTGISAVLFEWEVAGLLGPGAHSLAGHSWAVYPASEPLPADQVAATGSVIVDGEEFRVSIVGHGLGGAPAAGRVLAAMVALGFVASFATHEAVERRRRDAALAAAADAAAAKDRFFAMVGHSLRTPLTAIHGFLGLIREDGNDASDHLEAVLDQTEELSLLVDDLLLVGRLDQDSLYIRPEAVDLRAETERAIRFFDTGGKQVSVEGEATAWADPLRVRQIIRNLYLNALRHGGNAVTIRLSMHVDEAQWCISDDGSPIEGDPEDLFEPYATFNPRGLSPEPIGLGLTVSRRLALLQHGRLVYGQCGEHAKGFVLTLPAKR
ncbi:MAG: histidine kinase dimerization/phospho-acceptor domain-containing protein, partial [Acidimicrobiia bacterium]